MSKNESPKPPVNTPGRAAPLPAQPAPPSAVTQPAKPPEPQNRLKFLLGDAKIKQRFEEMLGKRAPGFISSILSAVNSNKTLADCEPMSIINAAAIAAAMDLPINPSLGFAHIVPYREKGGAQIAQFQMGWKGFIQLAMRSGQYKTMNITPVLEGQIKSHNTFTGDMEFQEEATSEKHAGYLLYFRLINGYEKYFYMTAEQCEAHGKRYSQSYKKNFGRWADDFEVMALKTVAKLGLSKYGILSLDMQRAIEVDQGTISEEGKVTYIDAPPDEEKEKLPSGGPPPGTTRLSSIMGAKKDPPKDVTPPPAIPQEPDAKEAARLAELELNDANEDLP